MSTSTCLGWIAEKKTVDWVAAFGGNSTAPAAGASGCSGPRRGPEHRPPARSRSALAGRRPAVAQRVLGPFGANRSVVPSNFALQKQEPVNSRLDWSEGPITHLISFLGGNSHSTANTAGFAFLRKTGRCRGRVIQFVLLQVFLIVALVMGPYGGPNTQPKTRLRLTQSSCVDPIAVVRTTIAGYCSMVNTLQWHVQFSIEEQLLGQGRLRCSLVGPGMAFAKSPERRSGSACFLFDKPRCSTPVGGKTTLWLLCNPSRGLKVWLPAAAALRCLEPPQGVLSVRSKPTDLRSYHWNNTARRGGSCSAMLSTNKQSKQQGLAFGVRRRRTKKISLRDPFKTKSGLNKTSLNRRLKHPFAVWGFVMDTRSCRTEVFSCRGAIGAWYALAPPGPPELRSASLFRRNIFWLLRESKGLQPPRASLAQPARSSGQVTRGLCNLITKARYKTIRHLLNLSRDNLTTFCKELRLPVYPDKSNKAVQYSRNRLREQILPAVKLFLNPKVDDALFKLAELLTQDFCAVYHLVNTGRRL